MKSRNMRKGKAQVPPSFPRGESSTAQVSKNPPPLLPLPVQSESSSFSLENELAKIKIFVPLKDLIRMPIHREAIDRFLGTRVKLILQMNVHKSFLV
jgi:hypothetical protein